MQVVEKGWGREEIFASNEAYCGKILRFAAGKKSSLHFHRIKDETFYVLSGLFKVTVVRTNDAAVVTGLLRPTDVLRVCPCTPHQIECVEEGAILEVSSRDDPADNFRVAPGDSQTATPADTGGMN